MSAYYVLCTRYLPFIVKILTRRWYCVTLTDKEQTGRWAQKSENRCPWPHSQEDLEAVFTSSLALFETSLFHFPRSPQGF